MRFNDLALVSQEPKLMQPAAAGGYEGSIWVDKDAYGSIQLLAWLLLMTWGGGALGTGKGERDR